MDRFIDEAMRPLADFVSGFIFFSIPILGADVPLIVVWLVAGGVFFTVYLRFINIRGFVHAIRVVSGRYKTPGDPGEVSQFQALTTAVSGTVGIGNIAGVAVAISIGGPGATFWLIVSGLLGMSTKFAECTLGVLYRRDNPDGSVSGGPMYYLERGLAERRWPRLGKALGAFYAGSMVIGCLGIGSMFQSNQATAIVVDVTGSTLLADNAWLVGATFAALVGLVIVGGIKSIAKTTVRLVPTMALLYVVSALVIIALNADRVPAAFVAIWNGAFAPEGVAGGIIGVIIIGFRRAVFSNEAGLGSAAIAHATARTPKPVSEGFVALLEPFIDTVVICTMTALVIITTVYDPALANGEVSGVELTTRAFASTLSWSPIGNYIFDSPKPLKAMQPLFVHHPAPTGKNNGSNARRLSIHVLTSAPSTSHRLRLAFSCRSAVTVNADPATSMLARAWVRCTLMAFLRAPFRILGLAAFLRGAVVEYTSRERVELRVGRPGLAFLRHAVNCS